MLWQGLTYNSMSSSLLHPSLLWRYQDNATHNNSCGFIRRRLLAISSDKTRQADMLWTVDMVHVPSVAL